MIKTKYWVLIFSGALFICLALWFCILYGTVGGTVANVYQDGRCIYSVDLSQVEDAYEVPVSGEWGNNTLLVENGRICVKDADCADLVCVHAGWLADEATPIVCLPHRLVIRIESTAAGASPGFDTVAG